MPAQRQSPADFARIFSKYGYTGVRKIGEGSFGMAVLVEDREKVQMVAKMVNLGQASQDEVKEAKKEANLLAKLKHPYIVRYREYFEERGWFGIVMDFAAGGDLEKKIKTAADNRKPITEEFVLKWFTQATLALSYLHGKHVLHRDLKPANLFLTDQDNLQIGDFGISKALPGARAKAQTVVGTPYYLSPEVIQAQAYTFPSDIWALGCILYQMTALRVPFDARNLEGLTQKICSGRAPTVPNSYKPEIRQICAGMMARHANKRPSTDAIIRHPLIQAVVQDLLAKSREERTAPKKPNVKWEIMDQFREFDTNGDGVVERDELAQVLKHVDASVWTDARIDALLCSADGNSDGTIQFDEFVQWVFGDERGQRAGLADRVKRLIELALKAVQDEDASGFLDALVCCRQAMDIGCLRVSAPELCVQTCEKLAWLGLQAGSLVDVILDGDRRRLETVYNAVRQMRAVLHFVEGLLAECRRHHVTRVAVAAGRTHVDGVCLELADGHRAGQMPGGLSDESLTSSGARWEMLGEGERILEVKGFGFPSAAPKSQPKRGARPKRGASPAAAPARKLDGCAAAVTFATNRSRKFEHGATMDRQRGTPFSHKPGEGLEVEELVFEDGECTAIKTQPFAVRWPKKSADEVEAAFLPAADAVCKLLLRVSWRMGPEQGKHALLQCKRLGLSNLIVPDDVQAERISSSISMSPPGHWDLNAMQGYDQEAGLALNQHSSQVELGAAQLAEVQALVDRTYQRKKYRQNTATSMMPSGLRLEKVHRLQNWRSWVDFSLQRDQIKTDLRRLGGDAVQVDNVHTDGHLASFATRLDEATHTVWLFHSVSISAAEAALTKDWDIDQCHSEDGKLYGRGLYFSECSARVDELSPDSNAGLHCVLLCRVALGHVRYNDDLLPDVVNVVSEVVGGPFHSVLGDREGRCPDASREFVVYDKDQVYPEMLVWYRRIYE